ncbi:MAG: TadE/TadG family type IV pilus assembly protein [Methylobacter sp.]|uniref:TadE/TadG family type IV pilus assembly protein n=1 Tax=Methylobacter sp. TaxID=2051955 RepID=UPI002730EA78|nr:TadE/TadG family type IV pilus assembly protein [Methylobacter sp.]MDP1666924.1 TadE/TadG family type IV pilus assembly protein [Methylobacter sp.]
MNIIKQKGTSTVEFAMILPVLLMLIFMVSELGTMFYRLNAVTKSVQDAARYLSDVSTNPNIALTNAQVKNLICSGDIGGAGAQIVPECQAKLVLDPLPSAASGHIAVSARYPADWILVGAVIAFLNLSGEPMELRASSVMRFAQ